MLHRYYLFGSPLVVYDDADDFYLTAPSPLGPWTYRGLIAPAGSRTFNSQVLLQPMVPLRLIHFALQFCTVLNADRRSDFSEQVFKGFQVPGVWRSHLSLSRAHLP